MNTNIKIREEVGQQPWWNRPLLGEKTLIDYMLMSTDNKQEIPQHTIYLHNKVWQKLELLTTTLKALLSEKFSNQDFLIFARIKGYLVKNFSQKNHYFNEISKFLINIINNLNDLHKLAEIEQKLTGENCQQFSQFVEHCLTENLSKVMFQETIRKQLELIMFNLSDHELHLLRKFSNQIYIVSELPNCLENFFLLKKLQLDDWLLFNQIANFAQKDQQNDFGELKSFILLVNAHTDWFKKLGEFFNILDDKKDSITYARILQYLALLYKYEASYKQFREFLKYLAQWEKTYYYIIALKEEYPINNYHYPRNFHQNIPGFEIYKVYHDYLDSSCIYQT